jgi:hypothetical protein
VNAAAIVVQTLDRTGWSKSKPSLPRDKARRY